MEIDKRDKKIIIDALMKSENKQALELFLEMIGETDTYDEYHDFIEEKEPTCKVCNKLITLVTYTSTIKFRHLDCGASDYDIGCCGCGDGPRYHRSLEAMPLK